MPQYTREVVVSKRHFFTRFDYCYIVLGCLSILPLFVYHNYHLEGTTLEHSLRDENVRIIFAASAAFSIPLILDLLMDLISPLPVRVLGPRIILISSMLFPSLIFLLTGNDKQYPAGNIYMILSAAQRMFRYY